ncbi:MAG: acyltransferase [Nitrospirae bacterium]|nr:acyltransferase [Nitrospirota bacterium]
MFIKIAGIQMSCSEEKDRNLKKAAEMAEYALENGAKIIAFQQLFHLPWFPADTDEARFALAEDADGPAISRMREVAAKGGAAMVCPIFERDGDNYYNTAFVIDADGSIAGKYRKVHVPDIPLWREKFYFSHGDLGFPVIQTKYAKIGVQLCWDVFFPEGARALALNGAEIIVAPTASAFASALRWERMITSSAIANGLYVFRINRVGGPERQRFYGKSFLVNPFGEITIEPTGKSDAVVLAELDTDEVGEAREVWNFMADRRPEHYGDLTEGRA